MQLHQIQRVNKLKRKKRVGRGGKRGTYSGRGIKGQKARAGRKLKPIIRELIKRYPKLRGYRRGPVSQEVAIVNLGVLEKKFQAGEKVTPEILVEKRIIRRIKGKIPPVKILAKGELKKSLVIENCDFSRSAKEIAEKAGCKII